MQLCFYLEPNHIEFLSVTYVRQRDENLRRRGIDPTDNESQIKAIEDRGKEILAEYKAQKEKCRISPREAEEILEPVHNAFKDLSVGLGSCTILRFKKQQFLFHTNKNTSILFNILRYFNLVILRFEVWN